MSLGTYTDPHIAKFVTTVDVVDPDSHIPIKIEIWKDMVSGGIFGIEALFMDGVIDEVVTSPFNRDVYLKLPEEAVTR